MIPLKHPVCFYPQLLQLVLVQPEQPDEPVEGVKSTPLLKPQADMSLSSFSPLQWGQDTLSSPKTRASNCSSHFKHLYSYMGISLLSFF
jgi:hypothetical protein